MSGVYIHIPFCRQACHYCNFHFSTSLSRAPQLIESISKEINERDISQLENTLDSIYLGGGTPSLLSKKQLEYILGALSLKFNWNSNTEFTIEVNPEDINAPYLQDLKSIGVNRLSIGIQSFDDRDLAYMNRAHSADQSHEALRLINEANFKSYSLDLMFGLINRTSKEWEDNLLKALAFNPPHISCYNLTIEEQTTFSKWKLDGSLTESKDLLQKEQYELTESILNTEGFDHYEISNYAIAGHQAVHNSNYWNKIPYIGYGPGAHSYYNGMRSWNIANNVKYIKAIESGAPYQESEQLSEVDIYNEVVMLGLRRKTGIVKKDILSLNTSTQKHWNTVAQAFIKEGILKETNNNYTLDRSWWYLSDEIAARLFLEN